MTKKIILKCSRIMMAILLLIILSLALFLIWSSQTPLKKGITSQVLKNAESLQTHEEVTSKANIKVMTYNLSFAYGVGNEGLKRTHWNEDIMKSQLNKLVDLIKLEKVDIILLQEIDFDSQRSFHFDQLNFLMKKTQLKFTSRAISWWQNFIPYPYFPILKKFGAMKSGGAILSRFPIIDEEIHLLDKPTNNPWWYNLFYLYRYFQVCSIELYGKKIKVINLHLEAYDSDNRKEQIDHLINQKIKNLQSENSESNEVILVGGDFNLLPPNATKKSDFSDGDDQYQNDLSSEILFKEMPLREIVSLADYEKNEKNYWTFPSNLPNRRLDYLFYQATKMKLDNVKFIKNLDVSDHLPVIAEFSFLQ